MIRPGLGIIGMIIKCGKILKYTIFLILPIIILFYLLK